MYISVLNTSFKTFKLLNNLIYVYFFVGTVLGFVASPLATSEAFDG